MQLRKQRALRGRFLAEGIRVVEDLLASPVRPRWAVTASSIEDTQRGRDLVSQIDAREVPRTVVPDSELARFAATEAPQGIIVVADIPQAGLDNLEPRGERSAVLALDAVQDPGNLGTMIRSAEALGVQAVLVLPGSADPWNPKSVRAAAGSSFRIPVVSATAAEAFTRARGMGYTILGASAAGPPLGDQRPTRVVLVMGNEGAGLSEMTMTHIDTLVGIPIRGRAESLNVTAAAAILMYELTR